MASVIGFAHRFRGDSFFRTECNLIALQIAYATILVAVSIATLFILYHDILTRVAGALVAMLTSPAPPSATAITAGLAAIRTQDIFELVAVIAVTAIVFGYLVTRFALAPARNALSAQKRFIGDVAHELRTPLAVIRTNMEVQLLEEEISKDARAFVLSNLEELDRISGLINNLLTLNAFLKPQEMPFGNVHLDRIAERVFDRLESLAKRRSVRLKLSATRREPAWGNAAALEQVLMNLVKNAVQHTEDGEVRVTIGPSTSGALELVVADTGTGIKREDLLHIFEPFYRGDRARARAGGAGSGLGLAIVNELVRLHRGRIRIQSAPEIGTRVTVTIPYGRPTLEKREGQREKAAIGGADALRGGGLFS